jgi:hypothetical protein
MAGSKTRPLLQAPDLSPTIPADASRPPPTDPNDSRLRGVQNGSVRTINPETMPRSGTVGSDLPAEPPKRRSPEVSLSTRIPEYVMRELRRRYADTGITIRVQVLLALIGKGFEIEEEDLQDERKHPRR